MKKIISGLLCATFFAAGSVSAQDEKEKKTIAAEGKSPTYISRASKELAVAAGSPKVVKNAPFSAEAVSESIQTLADGNRITKKSTVKMYRDSEGRFRRESLGDGSGSSRGISGFTAVYSTGVMPMVAPYGFSDTVSIYDPVAGVRYTLYPPDKTARRYEYVSSPLVSAKILSDVSKMKREKIEKELKLKGEKTGSLYELKPGTVVFSGSDGGGGSSSFFYTTEADKPESLGTKIIEGVEAEGTRSVRTIPAGAIGNDLPIEIVYEKWYSKELDMIVYSRNFDPRFGEQIYRLVNVDRSEPEADLFKVPADFQLVEGKVPLYFKKEQKEK